MSGLLPSWLPLGLSVAAHAAAIGAMAWTLADRPLPVRRPSGPDPRTLVLGDADGGAVAPLPPLVLAAEPSPTALGEPPAVLPGPSWAELIAAAMVPAEPPPAAAALSAAPPPAVTAPAVSGAAAAALPTEPPSAPRRDPPSAMTAPALPSPPRPVSPVEAPPAILHRPAPTYPERARVRGEEGDVVVAVELDAEGMPRAVMVRRSSGSPSLDRAALAAVRRWRFSPGRPGPTSVTVAFRLR